MGRRPEGTEQAAAALVAADLLRLHVWAVGYWVAYPAWPTLNGYTKGMLGYSQRQAVTEQVANAPVGAERVPHGRRENGACRHREEPEIAALCQRPAARRHSPQLRTMPRPRRTRRHRLSQPQRRRLDVGRKNRRHREDHPARHPLGRQGYTIFRDAELRFRQDSGRKANRRLSGICSLAHRQIGTDKEAAGRGAATFAEQCSVCHGEQASGNQELGAPNLADASGFTAAKKPTSSRHHNRSRRYDAPVDQPARCRHHQVTAVYVHGLGGGK